MTQEGLAFRCELSRKTVQRLERGEDVRADTVALVAAALGLSVDDLARADGRPAAREERLILRRARSGTRIFETLAKTYAGRITCDVEATGATLGPLTDLVCALQSLVSEQWGRGPKIPADLPLAERLRAIAALNDALRSLEAHGIGCFLGHYYRYVVDTGRSEPASARSEPLVLSRIHLTRLGREALWAPVEEAWTSRPASAAQEEAPLGGDEERFVFLEAQPPLGAADLAADDEVIDAPFRLLVS